MSNSSNHVYINSDLISIITTQKHLRMVKKIAPKWNERYRDGFYANRLHPCRLLVKWCDQFHGSRALDVACGAGRNSRFLASQGYQVTALDVSEVAIAKARNSKHPNNAHIDYVIHDLMKASALAKFRPTYVALLKKRLFPHRKTLAVGGHLLIEHTKSRYETDDASR